MEMWASSVCCLTLFAWTGRFPVSSGDKWYCIIAAVNLAACGGSRDGFHILAGIKSLQSSHSQLTSILCPIVSTWTSWVGHNTLRSVDYVNGVAVGFGDCRQWGWNRLLVLEVNGDGLCPGWCRATFTGGRSRGGDLNCEPAEQPQHRETDACSPGSLLHMWSDPWWPRK